MKGHVLSQVITHGYGVVDRISRAIASMSDASVCRNTVIRDILKISINVDGTFTMGELTLPDGIDVSYIESDILKVARDIRDAHPEAAFMEVIYEAEVSGDIVFLVSEYVNKTGITNPSYQ